MQRGISEFLFNISGSPPSPDSIVLFVAFNCQGHAIVAKAWVADLRHLLYDFEGYVGQS